MTALEWRAVTTSERDQEGMFRVQPLPNGQFDGGGSGSYKMMLPAGYFSRPLDADRDADLQPIRSCDALIGEDGEERFVMPTSDGRVIPTLPDPGKGSGGIYGAIPGPSWQTSYAYFAGSGAAGKTPGTFTAYVPAGSGSGAHTVVIDRANDKITIEHAIGHKITIEGTEVVIEFQTGGKITLSATGAKIEGTLVELGGSGGFPTVYESGSLAVFFANVIAAFSALGVPVAPPGAYSSATVTTRA